MGIGFLGRCDTRLGGHNTGGVLPKVVVTCKERVWIDEENGPEGFQIGLQSRRVVVITDKRTVFFGGYLVMWWTGER